MFTKCPTWAILRQSVSHHSTFVGKNWKKKRFLLTFVQPLQPTEILHYTKLLQNIKIKILCDISLYTRKILRSKAIACSDTSAILNLSLQGQQSCPIQFLAGYIFVFLCLSQSTKSSRRSQIKKQGSGASFRRPADESDVYSTYANKDLFVFH